ncbi:hypothetical protein [Kitasatospora sp. MBT63]|uniref:hypothetical protein n=1 Tax=Kitasatospora sp. MBT63 TaxID=1444768 RepID=UPI00068F731F|nr:hypothetical protein [Kitasatospora sp. MBT63]
MTDRHRAPRRGAAATPTGAPAAAWDLRVARAVPFALVCTLIAAAGHALVGGGEVGLPALASGFAVVTAAAVLLGGRERSAAAIAGALGIGQLGLHLLFHGLATAAAGASAVAGPMAGMTGMTGAPGTGAAGGQAAGIGVLPALAGRLICDDRPGNGPSALPPGSTAEQVVSAAGLDPQAYTVGAHAGAGHVSGIAAAFAGMSPSMLLGHLAAALVAGWWLRRGEAALWRLVRVTAVAAREWAIPLRSALTLLAAVLLGPLADGRELRRPTGPAEDWRLPGAAALRHSVHRRGPPLTAFAR